MTRTSTVVLKPPKGTLRKMSNKNKSRHKPASPMETQHNHFSMKRPFTACMTPPRLTGESSDPCCCGAQVTWYSPRPNCNIVVVSSQVATVYLKRKNLLCCPYISPYRYFRHNPHL